MISNLVSVCFTRTFSTKWERKSTVTNCLLLFKTPQWLKETMLISDFYISFISCCLQQTDIQYNSPFWAPINRPLLLLLERHQELSSTASTGSMDLDSRFSVFSLVWLHIILLYHKETLTQIIDLCVKLLDWDIFSVDNRSKRWSKIGLLSLPSNCQVFWLWCPQVKSFYTHCKCNNWCHLPQEWTSDLYLNSSPIIYLHEQGKQEKISVTRAPWVVKTLTKRRLWSDDKSRPFDPSRIVKRSTVKETFHERQKTTNKLAILCHFDQINFPDHFPTWNVNAVIQPLDFFVWAKEPFYEIINTIFMKTDIYV